MSFKGWGSVDTETGVEVANRVVKVAGMLDELIHASSLTRSNRIARPSLKAQIFFEVLCAIQVVDQWMNTRSMCNESKKVDFDSASFGVRSGQYSSLGQVFSRRWTDGKDVPGNVTIAAWMGSCGWVAVGGGLSSPAESACVQQRCSIFTLAVGTPVSLPVQADVQLVGLKICKTRAQMI